jgi:hypothetical protein
MDYHIDDAYGYIGDLGRIPRLKWLFGFLVKRRTVNFWGYNWSDIHGN